MPTNITFSSLNLSDLGKVHQDHIESSNTVQRMLKSACQQKSKPVQNFTARKKKLDLFHSFILDRLG